MNETLKLLAYHLEIVGTLQQDLEVYEGDDLSGEGYGARCCTPEVNAARTRREGMQAALQYHKSRAAELMQELQLNEIDAFKALRPHWSVNEFVDWIDQNTWIGGEPKSKLAERIPAKLCNCSTQQIVIGGCVCGGA